MRALGQTPAARCPTVLCWACRSHWRKVVRLLVFLASVWLSPSLGQRGTGASFYGGPARCHQARMVSTFCEPQLIPTKDYQRCPVQLPHGNECNRMSLRWQIWATPTDGHAHFAPSPGLRWLPRTHVRPGSGLGIYCNGQA